MQHLDHQLLEQALAYTSCGITVSDTRRPDMPLIFVNDAFEAMTGYGRDDVLGRNCRFLQRQDREQPALETLRAALREGRHCTTVLRNYRYDGSLFWNELAVSPIVDRDGEITHFVGIQTDVTQRERDRRRRERLLTELRAAYRELDAFAHVVSHDLRAPLRGIDRLCSLLVEQHSGGLDAEGRRMVGLIDGRIQRLRALLEGVLRYSRTRGEPATWTRIDLRRLVGDLVDLLEVPSSLRVELAPSLPVVHGDAVRLGQVLQNLLDNAIKVQAEGEVQTEDEVQTEGKVQTEDEVQTEGEVQTAPEGQIESGGWIAVGAEDRGEEWCVTVSDGGPGIAPEHQERIFGMFQTVVGRDRRETTGVGLAIVRKAVEQMGGRIWVESTPGEGAAFRFTLPKQPSEVSAPVDQPVHGDRVANG
ncbi:MAG: ATP-binding protein [Acidobacteriota bacterium]